ncbi:multidrug resistance efflux pump [Tahibacter aquaticus]|uniref:Multidrug resistance efflux pump n=1 Tax=Tahibacter aquaticus TaxID=520092 RepID=A0A4R6Z131_9GAMM|nr:HlyD family efflux transporter periplasmic adaptor subunit [Tahibacter aquaticus]TDR45089.1 multidrug resistance efflux pump [Tahibacter aquaticus]
MDITRKTEKKAPWKRYWPVLPAAVALLVALYALQSFGSASYVASRDSLIFGDVKRGDFLVQIRGVGVLVPKNIQWQAANVDGRVDSIAVEAGTSVKQGDVIASLSNPKLKLQLEESTWELEAQKKENRAAEMELRSELAEVRAEATNAELDFRSSKLKLDAEEVLVAKGIVSRITVEQSKLAVEQFKEKNKSQLERVSKMEANLEALIEAHVARMNKLQNTHNQIQQQIDDLTVKARIDGVVQEMVLKLGQQVLQGAEVARIAPHDNLVALLDIQDFQVRDVVLGQVVNVDTRSSKIVGKVVRIDPAVINGVVKVEVLLEGKMPPEARPDLSVEGVIDVERKPDALFVERPSFAQSFRTTAMYRLNGSGNAATRVEVQLGRASTRHIEVVNGLKEGDRIIVSDPSSWESHNDILIR